MSGRLILLISATLVATAQPYWRTSGACITPAGTLCRTLVYERSGLINHSWGIHAIERYRDQVTEAVSSNGTALLREVHRSFKFYFLPFESYDRTRIVIPFETRTLEIDRDRQQVREMGGLWRFSEIWTDDPDCAQREALASGGWRRVGERIVAGLPAVEYASETRDHSIVRQIALSRALGCTAVLYTISHRSPAGIPIYEQTLKLLSANLAEPDPVLFVPPKGFRVVGFDWSWPYIWMDKFPGNIQFLSGPVL